MEQKEKSNNRRKVILSVTNDLSNDQRVHKVTSSLLNSGFKPLLIGRVLKSSQPLKPRAYPTKRLKLLFNKKWLFYANYNICLFFYLLTKKVDILVANDLDSLLGNYLAFKVKKFFGNKKLEIVYDSHELFTELPELNNRNIVKKAWLKIEKLILPKIKHAYTVCQPIADYYKKEYNLDMLVIRNMPIRKKVNNKAFIPRFDFPKNKKIILYQGALNVGRGIENVIGIMDNIDNAIFLIIGTGDLEKDLKTLVKEKKLEKKVIFTGPIPFEELNQITQYADIGLVLQADISLSYKFVLPNRLFDFINAGIPVLASDLPELRKIVKGENIGLIIKDFDEKELVNKIKQLLDDKKLIDNFKNNLKNCSEYYTWEGQEHKLLDLYLSL